MSTISAPPLTTTAWTPNVGTATLAPSTCYEAIRAAAPEALPDAAVAIAAATARLAEWAPRKDPTVTAAAAEWARAVASAALAGDDLPSTDPVAAALLADHVADEVRRAYRRAWDHTLTPLGTVLSEHGDHIVATLQPAHDEALADYLTAVDALHTYPDETAVLAAAGAAVDHHQQAQHALARLGAIRHARATLDALPGYHVDAGQEDGVVAFRDPRHATHARVAKAGLQRLRDLATVYRRAGAWCPSKAEAEQRRDQLTKATS